MPDLTLSEWAAKVGDLPALVEHLAYDLCSEGAAPANAVAIAVNTLDLVARSGRTLYESKVPYRTRHAARDAVAEWDAIRFIVGDGPAPQIDAVLMRSLDEAADSMRKATVHEPVGKPGGPGLWHHKGLQLPAYIQHIANDIREKRGKSTSQAIAIAIGAVKRWARGGGGVDAGTKAAAAKALAEWEKLKATHNKTREAKFVSAASRLRHVVGPIRDGATFAKRYGNRAQMIDPVLAALRESRPLAVSAAGQILESDETDVRELQEALSERKLLNIMLMEALGYSATPIRATTSKHKGKFHGMHGVERAVKKRAHISGPGLVACPSCGTHVPGGAPCPNCGSTATVSMGTVPDPVTKLIQEAAPALAPAPVGGGNSAMFEQLHPRAAHGQFGTKPGQVKDAGANGHGTGGGGNELASAIRANDPEFVKQQKEIADSIAYGKAHPTGAHVKAQAQLQIAGEQVQNIGYADDPAGISQFQKDYGLTVTGKIDPETQRTIQNVYTQNASQAASRFPDFTGIAGAGAKVKGKATPRAGRSTKGKTSAKSGIREAAFILGFAPNGAPFTWEPTPGENHADRELSGKRQPGGDDMDFDERPELPPNLREREGNHACASCVHFSPKGIVNQLGSWSACMMYSFPVDRLDVCDDWLTLTPPDAPLVVIEARLIEATASGDVDEIVAARAGVKVLRERYKDVVHLPHPANADLAAGITEAPLTAEKRKKLKPSDFAVPPDGYPIHDESHARNALTRVAQHGSPEEKAKVRAAVKRRYPHISQGD